MIYNIEIKNLFLIYLCDIAWNEKLSSVDINKCMTDWHFDKKWKKVQNKVPYLNLSLFQPVISKSWTARSSINFIHFL